MTSKILCAFDGSEHSDRALMAAADLAARLSAKLAVCVVNVTFGRSPTGPQAMTWTDAEAEEILAEARSRLSTLGVEVAETSVVKDREASSGIINRAIAIGADHIVIGTGDKHGLERLVLGSVAKDVATRAHCTVTIVR